MAYSRAWNPGDIADTDLVPSGPASIRNFRDDVDDRLMRGSGGASTGLMDVTGTRTIDTDPLELPPDKADTISLDKGAGGWDAVARACTYFKIATLAADFNVALPTNKWQATGLTLTIPGTVLMASGLEHTNGIDTGTAAGSDDYAIRITAQFHCTMLTAGGLGLGAGANAFNRYRIRNTTNNAVIGPGSTEAIGVVGTDGVVSPPQNFFAGTADRAWLTWYGFDTAARTVATTYALEVHTSAAGINAAGGIRATAAVPAYLIAEVFKR